MQESTKKKVLNKTNKILLIILLALSLLYILSFTKSCSSSDKRVIIKSALVNKKYKDKIHTFELQSEGHLLTLSLLDNNWYVIPETNPNISLPADNKKVEGFINDLISVSEMYKISEKIEKNSAFGFTDPSSFVIRYYVDGDGFRDIIFGNQDFALSSRYMMSGKNTTVYEISNKFDKYLSTQVQSWTEPYIISQQFLGEIKKSDIQRAIVRYKKDKSSNLFETKTIEGKDFDSKLLELRHGGFPTQEFFDIEAFDNPLFEVKLEMGNKNSVKLSIVPSLKENETEYCVKVDYENNKENLFYTSYSKISGWTYNKITEIML